MNRLLQRLLLFTLLTPLLAVLALAALNLSPAVSLRLLIWTSPALPLGSWLALAVGGGGLLSAAATSAALQSGVAARRQVQLKAEAPGRRRESPAWDPAYSETAGQETTSPETTGRRSASRQNLDREANNWNEPWAANPAPARPPGAPPPTVEVPFRVIRKPARAASTSPDSQPPRAAATNANASANARASDSASANTSGGDGWDQSLPEQEEW
ncbi:MAG TPA: hypothetical protein DDY43_05380 [Synechococcales bacterium UBA10510]|nr:hypothetical protein [Synechococcales bacterium UBA10510]